MRELINAVEWVGVDGNILRLQTELAFDTTLDGVANRDVRQALAARVIEERGDQFDFVLVLTSFPFRLEFEDLLANGLYWQIANDVDGIGLGRFDQSTDWGSAGRLQGFIDLGEASPDRLEAGSFGYQFLLETATHELMHRWASYVRYLDDQSAVRDDLLGHLDTHWNTLLNNGASVMYGHDWRESEPGVFESGPVRRTYSELDLYLAGFMAASEVSPLELLRTSATDLPELPQAGLVTQGELDFVNLARVIDHEGPRVPSVIESPKHFRAALVLLSRPDDVVSAATLAAIERFRRDFQARFSAMTRGRAVLHLVTGDDPGVMPGEPLILEGSEWTSTTTVDLDAALNWLEQSRSDTGIWSDRPGSRWRDTAAAMRTLGALRPESATLEAAADSLGAMPAGTLEAMAWKATALGDAAAAGVDLGAVVAARHADGAWGLSPELGSAVRDTARLVLGFWSELAPEISAAALEFLAAAQNPDGSWGAHAGGGAHFPSTLAALEALSLPISNHDAALDAGLTWLRSMHRADGSFRHDGQAFPIGDTARALALLIGRGAEPEVFNSTLQWLSVRQGRDGDWAGSVHATAETLRTLGLLQSANLRVSGEPIAMPSAVVDGAPVGLSVRVANNGLESAPASSLRWYRGDPRDSGVPISPSLSLPAMPAGSSRVVEHLWESSGAPGEVRLWVEVDADRQVTEWTRQDNFAVVDLLLRSPPEGIDLALHSDAVAVSPDAVESVPAAIRVTGDIRNLGLTAAQGARLTLFDAAVTPNAELAIVLVDVPARGRVAFELGFEHDGTQSSDLLLVADTDGLLVDADRSNNQVALKLGVASAVDLAVEPPRVLDGSGPHVGRPVDIEVDLANRGLSPAAPSLLRLEIRDDGQRVVHEDDVELSLDGLARTTRRFRWVPDQAGPFEVRAIADHDERLEDVDRLNNVASSAFTVTPLTGTNLRLDPLSVVESPIPALEGAPYSVSAEVTSDGGEPVQGFDLGLYRGDPRADGERLATARHDGALAPGETAMLAIELPSMPLRGDGTFWLKADAADEWVELDEQDNLFAWQLTSLSIPDLLVQGADLSLSPPRPVPGQPVALSSIVHNLGQQEARNVVVELHEMGDTANALIERRTIDRIGPGSFVAVDWSWSFSEVESVRRLALRVDPGEVIVEQNDQNNAAELPIRAGDGPLFVSQRYISPNGDGVQDETLLVVRLEQPRSVEVVIERRGEIVRAFDDFDGQLIDRGQFAWDGRDAFGAIAPDGDYRARLRVDGREIASTLITVDTNRPSLAAAHALGAVFANRVEGFEDRSPPPLPVMDAAAGPGLVLINPWSTELKARLTGVFRSGTGVLEPVISGRWIEQRAVELGRPVFALHATFDDDRGMLAVIAGDRDEIHHSNLFELWLVPLDQADEVQVFTFDQPGVPIPIGFAPDGRYSALLASGTVGSRLAVVATLDAVAGGVVYGDTFPAPPMDEEILDAAFSFGVALDTGAVLTSAGDTGDALVYAEYGGPVTPLHQPAGSILWAQFARSSSGERAALHLVTNEAEQIWWLDASGPTARLVESSDRILDLETALLCTRLGQFGEPGARLEFDHLQFGMGWSPVTDELAIVDASSSRLRIVRQESERVEPFEPLSPPDYAPRLETGLVDGGGQVDPGEAGGQLSSRRVWSTVQRLATELDEFGPATPDCVTGGDSLSAELTNDGAPLTKRASAAGDATAAQFNEPNTRDRSGLLNLAGRFGVLWDSRGSRLMFLVSDAVESSSESNLRMVVPGRATRLEFDLSRGQFRTTGLPRTSLWPFDGQPDTPPSLLATSSFFTRSYVVGDGRDTERRGWWWSGGQPSAWLVAGPDRFVSRIWPGQAGYLLRHRSAAAADQRGLPIPVTNLHRLSAGIDSVATRDALDLGGFATDRNFRRWRIDARSERSATNWRQVAGWSPDPVTNRRFLRWPPFEPGALLLRLTTEDGAGNSRRAFRRVIVPFEPVPPVIELTGNGPRWISPNGDGREDRVRIDYTALRAEPFEVRVRDAFGNVVYRRVISHLPDELGPHSIEWDGRTDAGAIAPDSEYQIEIWNFAFPVVVDTTIPELVIERFIPPHLEKPTPRPPPEELWAGAGLIQARVTDTLDVDTVLEARPRAGGPWLEYARPDDLAWIRVGMGADEDYTRLEFRLRSIDAAGNEAIRVAQWPGDRLILPGFVQASGMLLPPDQKEREFAPESIGDGANPMGVGRVLRIDPEIGLVLNYLDLSLSGADDLVMQIRRVGDTGWDSHQIPDGAGRRGRFALPAELIPGPEVEIRLASANPGLISNAFRVGLQAVGTPRCWTPGFQELFTDDVQSLVAPDEQLVFWQAFSAPDFRFRELLRADPARGFVALQPVAVGRDGARAYAIPGFSPLGETLVTRVGQPDGSVSTAEPATLECGAATGVSVPGCFNESQARFFDDPIPAIDPASERLVFWRPAAGFEFSDADLVRARDGLSDLVIEPVLVGEADARLYVLDPNAEYRAIYRDTIEGDRVFESGPFSCDPAAPVAYRFRPPAACGTTGGELEVRVPFPENNPGFTGYARVRSELRTKGGVMIAELFDVDAPELIVPESGECPGASYFARGRIDLGALPAGTYEAVTSLWPANGTRQIEVRELPVHPSAPPFDIDSPEDQSLICLDESIPEDDWFRLGFRFLDQRVMAGVLVAEGHPAVVGEARGQAVRHASGILLEEAANGSAACEPGIQSPYRAIEPLLPPVPIADDRSNFGSFKLSAFPPSPQLFNGGLDLQFNVLDEVGARACLDRRVRVDSRLELINAAAEPRQPWSQRQTPVLSLNGLASLREVNFRTQAHESLIAGLRVHAAEAGPLGQLRPAATPVYVGDSVSFAGPAHPGSPAVDIELGWNGATAGGTAADGFYFLAPLFQDECRDAQPFARLVEVDSSAPDIVIGAPSPGETITASLVEIRGSLTDKYFDRWSLSLGLGTAPSTWTELAAGNRAVVEESTLGVALLAGLEGPAVLRVQARDLPGNEAELLIPLSLAPPPPLVSELEAGPVLFSPNGDGLLDSTAIRFGLEAEATIELGIVDARSGQLLRSLESGVLPPADLHVREWDGRDSAGQPIADGDYRVVLGATAVADPERVDEAGRDITVDTRAPDIEVLNPAQPHVPGEGQIELTWPEPHPASLNHQLLREAGELIASGSVMFSGPRDVLGLSELAELEEGGYRLKVEATDRARNETALDRPFVIDRTPPALALEHPVDGQHLRPGEVHPMRGEVVDKHLLNWELAVAIGEPEPEWIPLTGGDSAPDGGTLLDWLADLPDGDYLLRLRAVDLAGNSAEQINAITLDGTAPLVGIEQPTAREWVGPMLNVRGTVDDPNLSGFRVFMQREDDAGNVEDVIEISFSQAAVVRDVIADALPDAASGPYSLVVEASDQAGNTSTDQVDIRFVASPPVAPPGLNATVVNRVNVQLQWQAPDHPVPIAGYLVYRDGERLFDSPVAEPVFIDPDLADGAYRYSVTAVDVIGNEGEASVPVTVLIRTTPPEVVISSPSADERVRGAIAITGTARSPDAFAGFTLRARFTDGRESVIAQSNLPVSNGLLGVWDTSALTGEVAATLILDADDGLGNTGHVERSVVVDNLAPAAPAGLSAVHQGAGEVSLSWSPNSEADLLGYILFRDGQPVNWSGPLPADLRRLAIEDTSHLDSNVPDGRHAWRLMAVDQAGNLSPPSAPAELDIDRRAPDMRFVEPLSGTSFEESLRITATADDQDIVRASFAWRAQGDVDWLPLGTEFQGDPVVSMPIQFTWMPDGLPFGLYELTATAVDGADQSDQNPPIITVRFADLTPPRVPEGLVANVDGAEVELSWQGVPDGDLAGYFVYRSHSRINTEPLEALTFTDSRTGVEDIEYRVSAVDENGNESALSPPVSVRIHRPDLEQPFTPTPFGSAVVIGQSAVAGTVVGTVSASSGATALPGVAVEPDSDFVLESIPLALGTNEISVAVDDPAGNRSLPSAVEVSRATLPSPPDPVSVEEAAGVLTVNWTPVADPDVIGERLYMNGNRVLAVQPAPAPDTLASNVSDPALAFSDNEAEAWGDGYFHCCGIRPELEVGFASPLIVDSLELHWMEGRHAVDYDVLAWSGTLWSPLGRVRGNAELVNRIPVPSGYATDQIRVVVHALATDFGADALGLNRLLITTRPVLEQTGWQSGPLLPGWYEIELASVSAFGFEGPRSAPVRVSVGDVSVPAPVVLDAVVEGADVVLSWSDSPDDELDHYRVSRDGVEIARTPAAAGRSYRDAGLANGSYEYVVRPVSVAGIEGPASNPVTAVVDRPPPAVPVDLTVAAPASGGALALSWQPGAAAPPAAYRVNRAPVETGPFERIRITPETSLVDQPLTNGVTVFYTVQAVDAYGNVSAPSAVASGTPRRIAAPETPVIQHPGVAGDRVVLDTSALPVFGRAEPGVDVELELNGEIAAIVRAAEASQNQQLLDRGSIERHRTSANGRWLWLSFNAGSDAIFDTWRNTVTELDDLAVRQAFWDGGSGRLLVNLQFGEPVLVAPASGAAEPLAAPLDGVQAAVPSPVNDHALLVGSNTGEPMALHLWTRGQSSTTMLASVPAADLDLDTVSWAPDGRHLAWVRDAQVWVLDTVQDSLIRIGDGVVDAGIAWAPDSSRIAVRTGDRIDSRVAILDARSGVVLAGPDPDGHQTHPAWSADGARFSLVEDDVVRVFDAGTFEPVHMVAIPEAPGSDAGGGLQPISQGAIGWLRSMELLVDRGSTTDVLVLPGHFRAELSGLGPNDNELRVRARDEYGNVSVPSGILVLELPPDLIADLAIPAQAIEIIPPDTRPGDAPGVLFVVDNLGATESAPSSVLGRLRLADSQQVRQSRLFDLGALAPGQRQVFDWLAEPLDEAGVFELELEADAFGDLIDADRSNNTARRRFAVNPDGVPGLSIALESSRLQPGQALEATVHVTNSARAFDGRVLLDVLDAAGQVVAELETIIVTGLAPGVTRSFPLSWSPGDLLAGDYRLRARLLDPSGRALGQSERGFQIQLAAQVTLVLEPGDATVPNTGDAVIRTGVRVENANGVLPDARLDLVATDPGGVVVARWTRSLGVLLSGYESRESITWALEGIGPGVHGLRLELSSPVLTRTTVSSIAIVEAAPDEVLSGTLNVVDPPLLVGTHPAVDWSIRTPAGQAPDLNRIRIRLLSLADAQVLQTLEMDVSSDPGETVADRARFVLPVERVGDYAIVLEARADTETEWLLLANQGTVAIDGTPPSIEILRPGMQSIQPSPFELAVDVSDSESAIQAVEYRIGAAGPWQALDASGLGVFSTFIGGLPDGAHTVTVRAVDAAGNLGITPERPFSVDGTPPMIVVNGISDGAVANQPVSPEVSMQDANPDRLDLLLDGVPYQSGTEIAAEGPRRLEVVARDLAGNVARETLEFELDFTAPGLAFLSPPDGILVVEGAIEVTLRTEPGATVTLDRDDFREQRVADTNGLAVFQAVPLRLGNNTLIATARDPAGNTGTPIQHMIQWQPLSAVIAGAILPEQTTFAAGEALRGVIELHNPSQTNLPALEFNFQVWHPDVAVPLSQWSGQASLPANGSAAFAWSFATFGWPLGELSLALDILDNGVPVRLAETTVQLTDQTPPMLTLLQPGSGETVGAMVEVTAQVEDLHSEVATVEASIAGGAWLPLAPGSGDRYQGTVSNTVAGPVPLRVRAIDTFGNQSEAQVELVADLTPPEIQISGVADGQVTNQPLTPLISVTGAANPRVELRLNGELFQNGATIAAEGEYELEVLAWDEVDNLARVVVGFTIDQTPPTVFFTFPEPDARIHSETVPLSVVTEPGIELRLESAIASATVFADAGGIALVPDWPLAGGPNRITAEAIDPAGNAGQAEPLDLSRLPFATDGLAVAVEAAPDPLRPGQRYVLDISIANDTGAPVAGLPIRILIGPTAPFGSAPLVEQIDAVDIEADASWSTSIELETDAWPAGAVLASLQVDDQTDPGAWLLMAADAVHVLEPTGEIFSDGFEPLPEMEGAE